MRVSEALSYHMEECAKLKRIKERLEKDNEDLSGSKELNEMMIQEKVQQSKNNKQCIKEVCITHSPCQGLCKILCVLPLSTDFIKGI